MFGILGNLLVAFTLMPVANGSFFMVLYSSENNVHFLRAQKEKKSGLLRFYVLETSRVVRW